MTARYACEQGHAKVLWGMTGGWEYRTKFGTKAVDDKRCWYCSKRVVEVSPWPQASR